MNLELISRDSRNCYQLIDIASMINKVPLPPHPHLYPKQNFLTKKKGRVIYVNILVNQEKIFLSDPLWLFVTKIVGELTNTRNANIFY